MSMINVVGVVVGIVWSMVFFAERHSGFIWLAGALMLTGLGLILARPVLSRRAVRLGTGKN